MWHTDPFRQTTETTTKCFVETPQVISETQSFTYFLFKHCVCILETVLFSKWYCPLNKHPLKVSLSCKSKILLLKWDYQWPIFFQTKRTGSEFRGKVLIYLLNLSKSIGNFSWSSYERSEWEFLTTLSLTMYKEDFRWKKKTGNQCHVNSWSKIRRTTDLIKSLFLSNNPHKSSKLSSGVSIYALLYRQHRLKGHFWVKKAITKV